MLIFVPGNKGSHHQSRSILSRLSILESLLRKSPETALWSMSFNEEPSALSNTLVWRQAIFLARVLNAAMLLHPQARFQIVGHSMGGVVFNAALSILNGSAPHNLDRIQMFIGLSSPLVRRPVLSQFLPHFVAPLPSPHSVDLLPAISINIIGGSRDFLVGSDHALLPTVISPDRFHLTISASNLPMMYSSAEHRELCWCHEIVDTVARTLLAVPMLSQPDAISFLSSKFLPSPPSLPHFSHLELLKSSNGQCASSDSAFTIILRGEMDLVPLRSQEIRRTSAPTLFSERHAVCLQIQPSSRPSNPWLTWTHAPIETFNQQLSSYRNLSTQHVRTTVPVIECRSPSCSVDGASILRHRFVAGNGALSMILSVSKSRVDRIFALTEHWKTVTLGDRWTPPPKPLSCKNCTDFQAIIQCDTQWSSIQIVSGQVSNLTVLQFSLPSAPQRSCELLVIIDGAAHIDFFSNIVLNLMSQVAVGFLELPNLVHFVLLSRLIHKHHSWLVLALLSASYGADIIAVLTRFPALALASVFVSIAVHFLQSLRCFTASISPLPIFALGAFIRMHFHHTWSSVSSHLLGAMFTVCSFAICDADLQALVISIFAFRSAPALFDFALAPDSWLAVKHLNSSAVIHPCVIIAAALSTNAPFSPISKALIIASTLPSPVSDSLLLLALLLRKIS